MGIKLVSDLHGGPCGELDNLEGGKQNKLVYPDLCVASLNSSTGGHVVLGRQITQTLIKGTGLGKLFFFCISFIIYLLQYIYL